MGCNLCTLQKREEHYKLLYEIAQVNGRDFSKVDHEEAVVEAIRRDPIVVQVLRRTPARATAAVTHNHSGTPQDVCVVDVCTQTDITFEHIMALAKLRPATPPVPDICPFLLSDSCHSIHTMEHEFYECPEYLSNTPAEVERTEEYEFEEVELCRQNSQEKLGLTLCYRTDDEEDTAIYVSQINGCEVQDREKAVALLSSEEARSIVLLVTRPEMQLEEEGWLDEEQQELVEKLKIEILEERRKQREHNFNRGDEINDSNKLLQHQAEEDMTTDTATCSSSNQDSGFGRSTNSPEHQPLLARLQRRSPAHCLRDRWRAEHPHTKQGTAVPQHSQNQSTLSKGQRHEEVLSIRNSGGGIIGLEKCFQQLLELKCQIRNGGECGVYSIRHSIECSLTEPGEEEGDGADAVGGGGGVEQELRMLNEELRSIELECQSIMQAHQLRQTHQLDPSLQSPCSPGRSPKDGHKRHGRLADIQEHPERSDSDKIREKDSSSAYNTADSARSTPLGTERSPDHSLQRRISITNQKNLRLVSSTPSSPIPIPKTEGASSRSRPADPGPVISSSPDLSNQSRSESDPALPADDERCEKKGRTRDSRRGLPYGSSYQTTHYQGQGGSRQLQSYMQLLQQHSSLEYSQSQLSLLSVCQDPLHRSGRPGEPRLEWKVKVRADGTRYVARRPARDRILRERALRIREERSGGMTTDDDAMSEMKMGRYWSKEERKQHLARAREQRKRREFMQRSRLECLKEGTTSGAEGRKEINILELSHKKMMKKRNKKILDNWMTIQELMSHGARVPEGSKVHNTFLSVTTV
ncbi:PDZ domain-containing RING finger protein 4 Ligand of Numb protein X 4 SEMACAP3-like protein [Channa argus]|uniref:PDZ domain-containing RING finger protein 4 Ligand of Numb protein X 4 SEMACAP3-like protein n=1 Tax=Channa argus TaxID=215402 RepID=A0A6G1QQQ2_CHAAH|nr:PDZ domain-containing RING finger protein 4 Ligand of Numb protein X 4 SEMACAP3-like protein [Channa argus]